MTIKHGPVSRMINATKLAEDLGTSDRIRDGSIATYSRMVLGDPRGAHEVVYVREVTRSRTIDGPKYIVDRGQEGTEAQHWPAGTPMTWWPWDAPLEELEVTP